MTRSRSNSIFLHYSHTSSSTIAEKRWTLVTFHQKTVFCNQLLTQTRKQQQQLSFITLSKEKTDKKYFWAVYSVIFLHMNASLCYINRCSRHATDFMQVVEFQSVQRELARRKDNKGTSRSIVELSKGGGGYEYIVAIHKRTNTDPHLYLHERLHITSCWCSC